MKFGGETLGEPKPEVLVFPRGEKQYVLRCAPVLDFEEFKTLCPPPNPPSIMQAGETKGTVDLNDPEYIKALTEWATKQTDWMVIQSLKATPDIEWETVNPVEPDTFINWRTEMKKAGFSTLEITLVVEAATTASGLNQQKMDEARKAFLVGEAQAAKE